MSSFALDRYELDGRESKVLKELGFFTAQTKDGKQNVLVKPIKNLAQNPKSQSFALEMGSKIRGLQHANLHPLFDQVVASVDVNNILPPLPEPGCLLSVKAAERSMSRADHFPVLESNEITAIAIQLIQLLDYLHTAEITVRDLRPDALWLVGEGADLTVSVIDLSAATMLEDVYLQSLDFKTLPYVSPETVQKKRGFFADEHEEAFFALTSACDMWSLGIVLLELGTGFKMRGSVRRGSNSLAQQGSNLASSSRSGTQTPTMLHSATNNNSNYNHQISLTRSNSGSSLHSWDHQQPAINLSSQPHHTTNNNNTTTTSNNPHSMLMQRRNSEHATHPNSHSNNNNNNSSVFSFDEHVYGKFTEAQRVLFDRLSPWVKRLIVHVLVDDSGLRSTAAMETRSEEFDRELLRHDNAVQARKVQKQAEEIERLKAQLAQVTADYEAQRARNSVLETKLANKSST